MLLDLLKKDIIITQKSKFCCCMFHDFFGCFFQVIVIVSQRYVWKDYMSIRAKPISLHKYK